MPNNENTLLHLIAQRPELLEEFNKRLQLLPKEKIPILLSENYLGQTPLDIAVENNHIRSIFILIDMMTKYNDNIMLNRNIDKNLCKIIQLGIDLKEYFESSLSISQIKSSKFPSLHEDGKSEIYGFDFENISTVYESYSEIKKDLNGLSNLELDEDDEETDR